MRLKIALIKKNNRFKYMDNKTSKAEISVSAIFIFSKSMHA